MFYVRERIRVNIGCLKYSREINDMMEKYNPKAEEENEIGMKIILRSNISLYQPP